MQLGMIGLGRMGGEMVRRLLRGGHTCVVFDSKQENVTALAAEGAAGARSLRDFVDALQTPRAIWLMVPAAAVEGTLAALSELLQPGDIVIDGGNSHYVDDIHRARALQARRIDYVDAGVSGGVWGGQRGYCLMIGGAAAAVARLDPCSRRWLLEPTPRLPQRGGRQTARPIRATCTAGPRAPAIS